MTRLPRLSILGGTGPFGRGLAWRLARGGAEVVLGSRDADRAARIAAELREAGAVNPTPVPPPDHRGKKAVPGGGFAVSGTGNREAAERTGTVFLAVPFAVQRALLHELAPVLRRKLVIACGVIWPPGSRFDTSAAEEAVHVLLGAGVRRPRVAAAFQTVAAATLRNPGGRAEEPPDVLVFADRDEDRVAAAKAAALTGLRAIPVGGLAGARAAEAVLGVLVTLNRSGTARHAGLRLTGLRTES